MESGMHVDLHGRGTSRNRLLLTGQAIVPMLIILTTSVSCSRRAAEMPEPPYRIVERILPFSSSLSDDENRQLVQRRSDAKPNLQQVPCSVPRCNRRSRAPLRPFEIRRLRSGRPAASLTLRSASRFFKRADSSSHAESHRPKADRDLSIPASTTRIWKSSKIDSPSMRGLKKASCSPPGWP